MKLSALVRVAVSYLPITPTQVTEDIKRHTTFPRSFHHPKLGLVQSGLKSKKISRFAVSLRYELHSDISDVSKDPAWSEEFHRRWRQVLDAAVKAGYTIVADALSSSPVFGDRAYQTALQNGSAAVVKQK